MRAISCSLLLAFALVISSQAQLFPEIPKSSRVLSLEEVKNYWVNQLPVPEEPSSLSRNFETLSVQYYQQIGQRHRLVQAVRSGSYEEQARLVMLRHNLNAYRLIGDEEQVAVITAELTELEEVAKREAAERENNDRLERLIAATERLAAAIETNGGSVPENAELIVQEIVPFERDHDRDFDRGDGLMSYLYDEIALCRQPIIVHRPYDHREHSSATVVLTPAVAPSVHLRPAAVLVPQVVPRPSVARPSQPRVAPARAPQQPQVAQPKVRPAR